MPTFRIVSVLLMALALAAPAAAFAQSAGDEQYTDPFQEEAGGGGGQQDGGQSQPEPQEPLLLRSPLCPESDFTDPSAGATSAQPGSVAPDSTNTLPVTGLPAALSAGLGAAFTLGGALLRRTALTRAP